MDGQTDRQTVSLCSVCFRSDGWASVIAVVGEHQLGKSEGSELSDRDKKTDKHTVCLSFVYLHSDGWAGVKAVVGEHQRGKTEGSEQTIFVQKAFIHPDYNGLTDNDICLVKLSKEINFNSYVQPACLPKEGQGFCHIALWAFYGCYLGFGCSGFTMVLFVNLFCFFVLLPITISLWVIKHTMNE